MSNTRKELFRFYQKPLLAEQSLATHRGAFIQFESKKTQGSAIVCSCGDPNLLAATDLEDAFEPIKNGTKENEIIISAKDSPLITHNHLFKELPLPENITSVILQHHSNLSAADYANFIKKLPKHVLNLTLELDLFEPNEDDIKSILSSIPKKITSLNLNFFYLAQKNNSFIKQIISHIPDHITSITLPNIFHSFEDNEKENNNLAQVFGAFHKNVTKIDTSQQSEEYPEIEDSRLKKVLLYVPFSVATLSVQGKPYEQDITAAATYPPKIVHMQTFREKNYFPNYDRVINSPTEAVPQTKGNEDPLFAKAKRILNDYSKHDSVCPPLALFFSGRWNLHHVDRVNQALDTSKTFKALYDTIKKIELDNPNGSLARRIRYIQSLPEFKERFPEEIQQSNPLKIK